MKTKDEIIHLISELRSTNGTRRERAREALVHMGTSATKPLLGLLTDQDAHVRWEAVKALGAIKDPAAAGALADALRDDNNEVRWLAGEALVALERRAILPVLRALEMHFDSIFLRHGAYHVLHVLERENTLSERTMAVLDSLRSSDPGITIAWNAHKAVEFLKRSAPSLPGAMETPATKYFPR